MVKKASCIVVLLWVGVQFYLCSQNIPIGSWRSHADYSNAKALTFFNDKLFCLSSEGIFFYDLLDQSINTLTPADGLSGITPTALLAHTPTNQLYISYTSGLIDVIDMDFNISTFKDIFEANDLESKRVNALATDGERILISTDFGLVILNANTNQLDDSYINLSATGDALIINNALSAAGTLYLSTSAGLLTGKQNAQTNLKDFRNWNRSNVDSSTSLVKSVFFQEQLFTLTDSGKVFIFHDDTWRQLTADVTLFNNIFLAGNTLKAASGNQVFSYRDSTFTEELTINEAGTINQSISVATETYVAHSKKSLALVGGNELATISPNGPKGELSYLHQLEDFTLYFSSTTLGFSFFTQGVWNYQLKDANANNLPYFKDATLDLISGNGIFLSPKDGLYSWDTREITAISVNNSDLLTWHLLATDNLGIAWALCQRNGFYELYNTSTAEFFPIEISSAQEINDYVVAPNGDHYLASNNGLIVFNTESGDKRTLIDVIGNGNLPSATVHAMQLGLDGKLWLGTARGVGYFTNYAGVLAGVNVDAVRPIFEGFFLFDGIAINTVAIDGGNRLWVGNRDGLWLFDEETQTNLLRFTTENSPLVNQKIDRTVINPLNGEAFIQAGDQLLSYRTASSRAGPAHTDVKVFPNPVFLKQHTQVSVTGIAYNNEIMITDLAGNLVYKGAANGGTFTWNLQNYSGFTAKAGVYSGVFHR